jgi:hypothetical protein
MKKYNLIEHITQQEKFLRIIYDRRDENDKWLIRTQNINVKDNNLNVIHDFRENVINIKMSKTDYETRCTLKDNIKTLFSDRYSYNPILETDRIRKLTLKEYILLSTYLKKGNIKVNKKTMTVIEK